jgi:hypothetical protein
MFFVDSGDNSNSQSLLANYNFEINACLFIDLGLRFGKLDSSSGVPCFNTDATLLSSYAFYY